MARHWLTDEEMAIVEEYGRIYGEKKRKELFHHYAQGRQFRINEALMMLEWRKHTRETVAHMRATDNPLMIIQEER